MNLQEKLFETLAAARARAQFAAKRVNVKGSLATLTVAGRELNKVARRHAARFVKENSTIAVNAGKDVSALARSTFATLSKRAAQPKAARKAPAARKRAARKAA
jgi:hypothetical protein